MFTLTPRLATAVGMLPEGVRLADIGCDHGKLPIHVVKYLHPERVIACDINVGPLERARDNCRRFGCLDAVELRLGDGLSPVKPDECTHITICGMGGELIADILAAAPWTRGGHTLILQPETAAHKLRAFLYAAGYTIEEEIAVIDAGRMFTILRARGTDTPVVPQPLDIFVSPALARQRDEAALRYFTYVSKSLSWRLRGFAPDSVQAGQLTRAKEALEAIIRESMAD